jgi:hypothetical protein
MLLLIKDLVAGSKVGGCRDLSFGGLLPLATSGLSIVELTPTYAQQRSKGICL